MGCQVIFGGYHSTEWKNSDLRLSDGCPDREELDEGEVATRLLADHPLPDDGLFLSKQSPFSRVYDHSLPHSRLATGDVEGEWRTRAPIGPSCSSPCSRLLLD
ncbi:unnamed protein product [Spirodela intermedia]|uniref:Uncharacterized protein n=1 Tax=Spirodela intermedia TaxID=51605 RepID=A0A7I8IT84_SPIIN|nr:unnamed protein product [Spirodela intermedia]CAA6660750.1 unnamed protein product [Spirodela intermedia]